MNNMNAIRWVFFDIGSTLVDEEEAYESIFIVPCIQPTSNYTYQIDDAYIQKVNALFDK